MKVKLEPREKRVTVLEIEVDAPEMEKGMEEAYHHVVKRVRVPGFRLGKAPRSILENYAGKSMMLQEAIEHLVPDLYEQAIKEQNIEAVAEPTIEILKTEPVVFKATVSLRPTVELGDYKQLRIPTETVEITEQQVNSTIEQLRQEQAPWEPADRPVILGDLVTMDVVGKEDGKTVADQKGVQYLVVADSQAPVPGFAAQVEGMEKGKEKS